MTSLDQANNKLSQALYLEQIEGRPDEAEHLFAEVDALLNQAIANDPENAQVYMLYARLFESRRQYDEAKSYYRQALDKDPADPIIQANYQGLLEKLEDMEEMDDSSAMPDLEDLSISSPSEEDIDDMSLDWEADIEAEHQATPTVTDVEKASYEAEGYWAWGKLKMDEGDLVAAEEAFLQALKLQPGHADTARYYTHLLLEQQRYVEAGEYLSALPDPMMALEYLDEFSGDGETPLLWLRGTLLAQQGNLEAAKPLLSQALEMQPDQVEWVLIYTELLEALDLTDEAIDYLNGALTLKLEHPTIHCAYARLMEKQGDYEAVQKHIAIALTIDEYNSEANALRESVQEKLDIYHAALRRMALATLRAKGGFYQEAEMHFEEAIEIDEDNLAVLEAYAEFLEDRDCYDDAEQIWTTVATKAPENAVDHFMTILQAGRGNYETHNRLARVFLQLKRFSEAEDQLQISLQLAHGEPETLDLLVDVLEKQNHPRKAEGVLADNLVIIEKNVGLCLRYARLLALRRNFDAANKYFKKARVLAEPFYEDIAEKTSEFETEIEKFKRANLEMAMGWNETQIGNNERAEYYYRRALEIDPNHLPTLSRYAQLLEVDDRVIEAGEYLSQLAKYDPDAVEEHYRSQIDLLGDNLDRRCAYAVLLKDMGRIDEASEQFKIALESQPGYINALIPYVDILVMGNKTRKAELLLAHALEQELPSAEVHWRYATMLIESRHRYDLAQEHLARAVEFSDDLSPDSKFRLSYDQVVQAFDRDAEEAYAFAMYIDDPIEKDRNFKIAYEILPDYVLNLLHYGEFLTQQDRQVEALYYWQKAIKLDPYNEYVERIREFINSVQEEVDEIANEQSVPASENTVPAMEYADLDEEIIPNGSK